MSLPNDDYRTRPGTRRGELQERAGQSRFRSVAATTGLSMLLAACTTTVAGVAPSGEAQEPTTRLTPSRTATATGDDLAGPATPATTASTASPTSPSSTTTSSSTTTVPDPWASVANAECVRMATTGETLEDVAVDEEVAVDGLWVENQFRDDYTAGEFLDVCVGNGIDDITGDQRAPDDDPSVESAFAANVERQQRKLNDLFEPYGTRPLAVDGISGPLTGQRLCGARLALGLEPRVDDMQPGSDEHAILLAADVLSVPASSATESERWVLIDRTCQMMFIGTGGDLVFAFPTATGTEGFETRDQDRSRVFRYNPAIDNGGWHDSTLYPVGVDNPLNGNLYKPLYFDLGQAIHGATSVPPAPTSKGCARLSVANQEALLDWLGLLDATEETWRKSEINLTVNVQGDFVGR